MPMLAYIGVLMLIYMYAGGQTSSQATSFAGKSYPVLPPLFRTAAATLAVLLNLCLSTDCVHADVC